MIRLLLAAFLLLLAGCSAPAPAVPVPGELGQVATPTRIEIPAIDVAHDLIALGLNPDDTLAVPPVDQPAVPSWYDRGPRPGEPGPAVIAGHVNGEVNGQAGQPGVFADLHSLAPGDEIHIDRADGSQVTFAVDRVEQYPKDAFPTAEVYGDTEAPELRLITCAGSFDHAERSYRDNIIVYATVVA